ncbi:LysR family transcriptional regulator [Mycobacterium saskatchewanense]|uniref:Probable hydrogen peroxide-inducible genes activator n=1 Tax=Mycobacterium saskatchewanense TaxID=220927 RepID=A0AAJ3NKE8_9MYCO|nr:LysR family transcriptional regulator [Mycobacterium saskatchewanense]ORW64074.1 LysR family transcriptional regulator [Mycobacterium saskatchewanense]BBX62247.1 LysR family transcriptional regulator [Mycobacterium saskatchewanense]
MNVDELHWFVVLAETEHMTEAAQKLNVAQPTLSRGLKRLERELHAPLFDRVNNRLHLNAYGRIMLEHSRRGLAEIRAADERIAALRDPDSGTVRLAFLHSMASYLVPDVLRRFRLETPRVRFDLRQAAGHEIVELLTGGRVDLAITGPRPDSGDFGWHQLLTERLCLVLPRNHRLADRRRINLAETEGESYIALGTDFALRGITNDLWAAEGINPRVVFEAMEIATIEGLVAAGLGVGVVPMPPPHRREPAAVYVSLSNPRAKRPIGLAWPHERPIPPPAQRFAAFVKAGQHRTYGETRDAQQRRPHE